MFSKPAKQEAKNITKINILFLFFSSLEIVRDDEYLTRNKK